MNPQLVFFGEPSYLLADEKRGHQIMDTWISNMESDFDLILILEELDTSLALLVLKFCWEVRDVVHLKLNSMKKEKQHLGKEDKQKLHKFLWADHR